MKTLWKLFKRMSKEERMLKYLKARQGKWVNWWKMVQYVKTLHHTQLISNLRAKWYVILNKTEYNKRDGVNHTFYKLLR